MSAAPFPAPVVDPALARAHDLLLAERIAHARIVDGAELPARSVLAIELCADGAAIVDVRLVVPAALMQEQREVEAEQGGGQ